MKENKINWWLIIGIVVVVAVITALVTLQVTGNVISVAKNTSEVNSCRSTYYKECVGSYPSNGLTRTVRTQCSTDCKAQCPATNEVYTKAEVDALLAKISVGGSTPKNCMSQSFTSAAATDGNALCRDSTKNICLISEVTLKAYRNNSEGLLATESRFIPCDYKFSDFDEHKELNNSTGIIATADFEVICCD